MMMNQVRENTFLSPVVNRGFRKPFGDLTNTPPSGQNMVTPSKSNTPTGKNSDNNDPTLTPMANLKLLMRVASETAFLQDQPSRRELFKESDQQNAEEEANALVIDDHDYSSEKSSAAQTPNSCASSISSCAAAGGIGAAVTGKVSRKDKSLGLLCDKFISRFPESVEAGDKCEIHLDDLARQMSTERRRIYDIVNVLEAVQMMTKIGKNLYQWHGTTHQLMTLAWLKQLALKLNMEQRYLDVRAIELESGGSINDDDDEASNLLKRSPLSLSSTTSAASISASPATGATPSPSPAMERKTSLGVACQKFLMLFLAVPETHKKVNLEVAAKVIHGTGLSEAIMKTRIRRLYDIANILQSLKLIEKVTVTDANGGKKPAFQYIGPIVDGIEVTRDVLQTLPTTRQRHSLLTFGKNLLNLPDEEPGTGQPQSGPRKRIEPDSGFSSPVMAAATKASPASSEDFNFAVPSRFRRSSSGSLLDLSRAALEPSVDNSPINYSSRPSPTTRRLMMLQPVKVPGGTQMSPSSGRQLFKSPVDPARSLFLSPGAGSRPSLSPMNSQRFTLSPSTSSRGPYVFSPLSQNRQRSVIMSPNVGNLQPAVRRSPVVLGQLGSRQRSVVLSPNVGSSTNSHVLSPPAAGVSLLKKALTASPGSPQSQPQDLSLAASKHDQENIGPSVSSVRMDSPPIIVRPPPKKRYNVGFDSSGVVSLFPRTKDNTITITKLSGDENVASVSRTNTM